MAFISIVTGASSGLGREISKSLCEKGHTVYVVARNRDKLKELQKECRDLVGEIKIIVGNLTDKGFRASLIRRVLRKSRKIDYLINNAGYGTAIMVDRQPIEDGEKMFNLNMLAVEHLVSMALPGMKKRKSGKIIAVSSVVAITPLAYFATYNATKAAVFNFVRSLRYELRGTGVTASVVLPARMKTGFGQNAFKCYRLHRHKYENCIRRWNKRAGSPKKVAKKIVDNLDTSMLLILPGLKPKLFYILTHLPFGSWLADVMMKNLIGPGMKKDVNVKNISAKYYKH